MTSAPLVSIIINNYNHARVLETCLRAARAQTYPHTEIVFVDDCSTDASVAIAQRLGIPVLRTPANGGPSVARNLGVGHAGGEVLFFLDSDVALAPDAVANALAVLRSDPGIGAVSGTNEPDPLTPGPLVREHRNLYRHYIYAKSQGSDSEFLNSAMVALPAAVWAEVGPWNPRLRHSEGSEIRDRLAGRYDNWLAPTVRGRHDDDRSLWVALRKVFTRTRRHVPLFLRPRKAAGIVVARDTLASGLAALPAASIAVPLLTRTAWLAVLPVSLLVGYLSVDRDAYRFVFARRGTGFGVGFVCVHFLVNLSIAAGVAVGTTQWLLSGSFRRSGDPTRAGSQPAPAGR